MVTINRLVIPWKTLSKITRLMPYLFGALYIVVVSEKIWVCSRSDEWHSTMNVQCFLAEPLPATELSCTCSSLQTALFQNPESRIQTTLPHLLPFFLLSLFSFFAHLISVLTRFGGFAFAVDIVADSILFGIPLAVLIKARTIAPATRSRLIFVFASSMFTLGASVIYNTFIFGAIHWGLFYMVTVCWHMEVSCPVLLSFVSPYRPPHLSLIIRCFPQLSFAVEPERITLTRCPPDNP